MIPNSFNFLLLFPLVAILYYLTPAKYRWITLLTVSWISYINIKPVFALLLLYVTLSTYILTIFIEKSTKESTKRLLMRLNIFLILLPLFFFKYFGKINSDMIALLDMLHLRWPLPEIKLLLPIGISYYTFMAIGYTIDVYNEEVEAEKNIGIVALFISFFPIVLSGPIERAKNMMPQFKSPKDADYTMIVQGMKLMLWGFFMKLVVANRIAITENAIFDHVPEHNGTSLLYATILYPFQLYADLGGYSLIAIGTARILGINVMQNFNRPFFATSMSEFWRRWHISLIKWLTDYIFIPLSFTFRKYKEWGIVISLMITFLISGIWHGSTFNYVIWGAMQGVFLSAEALFNKRKLLFEKRHSLNLKTWYLFFGICLTFFLFTSSEIFGNADNINETLLVYKKIFTSSGPLFIGRPSDMIFGFFGLSLILIKEFTDEYTPNRFLLFENKYKAIRIMAFSSIILLILLIGVFDGGQFLYFQF